MNNGNGMNGNGAHPPATSSRTLYDWTNQRQNLLKLLLDVARFHERLRYEPMLFSLDYVRHLFNHLDRGTDCTNQDIFDQLYPGDEEFYGRVNPLILPAGTRFPGGDFQIVPTTGPALSSSSGPSSPENASSPSSG